MTNKTRRSLLQGGAALTGTLALGFPAIVRAQTDKIKIGHLTPLTGFLGALGAYAQLGMRMAEEEITKALDRVLLWNHYVVPQWNYPKVRTAP